MIWPTVPWADRVHLHLSDEGTRADLDALLSGYRPGWHVYTCGPDRYMDAVIAAAQRQGYPGEARHLEYFAVPELPDYVNHPFTLRLARSGRDLHVPADQQRHRCSGRERHPCGREMRGRDLRRVQMRAGRRARSSTAISCCPRRSARARSSCAKAARRTLTG